MPSVKKYSSFKQLKSIEIQLKEKVVIDRRHKKFEELIKSLSKK